MQRDRENNTSTAEYTTGDATGELIGPCTKSCLHRDLPLQAGQKIPSQDKKSESSSNPIKEREKKQLRKRYLQIEVRRMCA